MMAFEQEGELVRGDLREGDGREGGVELEGGLWREESGGFNS